MSRGPRILTVSRVVLALTLGLVCRPIPATAQSDFEAQRKAAQIDTATQPEATILTLLEAGLAEHKPTQAFAVTQDWLRENVVKDPTLLHRAGRAAELSGDWKSAAALYRQYLQRADLKTADAAEAILATYTLLLNQLNDPESAYAFARSEGHDLAAAPQARQFDRWFLDEAQRRGDIEAVAARLLALQQAPVTDDLLLALHQPDFRWLLSTIAAWRLDVERFPPRLVQTVKALAQSIKFDSEVALLLDWEVSVKAYLMNVLDGKEARPPLAEAEALLKAYPRYAQRVQTGWAGGHRGPYYRDDPRKYWPLDLAAKLEPVKTAAARLDPMEQSLYYRSWSAGYYAGGPNVVDAPTARTLTRESPQLVNSRIGPSLAYDWMKLNPEEAKRLAAALQQSTGAEASLIAVAAALGAEKSFDRAVQTALESQAWRLTEDDLNGRLSDQLWHWLGRPGGYPMRDAATAKTSALLQTIKASLLKPDAPAPQRIAAFKQLWQEYRSPQPKTQGLIVRLQQALRVTPEALPELLSDQAPEAQLMAHDALEAGFTGADPAWAEYGEAASVNCGAFDPNLARLMRVHRLNDPEEFKRRLPQKYLPHPLHAVLLDAVANDLKQNRARPWLVLAWLNTRFPQKNEASVKLSGDLFQSPLWKTLPYEVRYSLGRQFPGVSLTPAQLAMVTAGDPNAVCQPLLTLPNDADAAITAAALSKTIQALRASPLRLEVRGLERLAKIKPEVFKDPTVLAQVYELTGALRTFQTDESFGTRYFEAVLKQPTPELIHVQAPYLWRHTQVHHRTLPTLLNLTDALATEQPSAAEALARCGLQTFDRYTSGHMYFNRNTDVPRLTAVRGKAAIAMGLINIPVPQTHPAYGVYESQAQFILGNQDSARKLYVENADQLMTVYRKLTVPYLLWVLQYTIDQREQERQEELAKALLAWMEESAAAFSLEQRVTLEIAYGDIAMQRGLLPEAQKIFTRVASNPQYESVFARHTATLRRVLVERVSGDYDGALQTLLEMQTQKIPSLTTAAHHARAEVYYAMEDYALAADEVAKVLERDPNHADATILRGRVHLKLQKLVDATEVEIGSATSQETLVPGQTLKVTLNDPTLAVSSGGTEIEVVVWSSSGDREHTLLRQFGDQRTKYRGEVTTALGPPKPDDRTLQIVGDDEIFYAYSEAFRAKMPGLAESRGGPIRVASDALLMASARRLLSENEQRVADMRAATQILAKKQGVDVQNADPEALAELLRESAERARQDALQARVKPGNPIYLRVIDPDRGRTAQIDTLAVSVGASSGDSVGRVVLKETGPYSGRFEGQLPTTKAQALAYATSTEAGRNPNMVISPNTQYPAWRPVLSDHADHVLTVDLNDNATPGTLRILATDEGQRLKQFLVQTALRENHWTTVASYPLSPMTPPQPWGPSVTVMNEEGRNAHSGARSVYELDNLRRYFATGWLAIPDPALAKNVTGPSQMLPASVTKDVKWLRSGRWPNPAVVGRFQAYFYEPSTVTRRFALHLGKHDYKPGDAQQKNGAEFLIAVDGRVITEKTSKQLAGEVELKPGLHQLEVWFTGWIEAIGFGREVKLQANLDDPDVMIDCPDGFFDPATFPPGLLGHRNAPAELTVNETGTEFTVRFAPQSQARLVRVVTVAQEGPVPAINRLTLDDAQGRPLLPVPEDYAQLRKNDTLEIITGDELTVRYVDDRFVSKDAQNHERFLVVSFTDGQAEFADIQPRFSSRHQKDMPYHERLLRFPHNEALPLVIHDADMDVSVEPDRVRCTVVNDRGEKRELVADETGPSTGAFLAWVTPVAEPTTDKDKITVAQGGQLTLTYRDEENLSPGVPYDRVASIQHAAFTVPRIEVANMTVQPLDPAAEPGVNPGEPWQPLHERLVPILPHERTGEAADLITPRFKVTQAFTTMTDAPPGGLTLVHGHHAMIDVVAPGLALREGSTVEVFVQTDAGRAAKPSAPGQGPVAGFDIDVPGTMRYVANLGLPTTSGVARRGGYFVTQPHRRGGAEEQVQLDRRQGRFRVHVPLITGVLPPRSFAYPAKEGEALDPLELPHGLVVRTGEKVHIGVTYTDEQGQRRWATAQATIITRPMLDVMREDYRTPMTEAHVGERLHLRVVDLAQDRSDDRDTLEVYMASRAGVKLNLPLRETDAHSGVFKAAYPLGYATPEQVASGAYDVAQQGFPVTYGDAVGMRYTDPTGLNTPVLYVGVAKGADGAVAPFSKRYDDSAIAMQTQFAMAESYLELARRHRDLKQEEQAAREFASARQLLAQTITFFTDPQTRAHAEFLLGNLTLEDAQAAEQPEVRNDRYRAALSRYTNITGNYPDSLYAAKAQFQIAVIYERLGEPDIAAQEYVKLAYKHPESENLATAMARLGTHFQRRGTELQSRAQPLLEKVDDKDAQFDGQALMKQARQELTKAAQIFERLQSRFPDHELAGKAGLRAGQLHMNFEDYRQAAAVCRAIFENESYDGATLRAEAMYWAGMSYQAMRETLSAYALFKRITYDFPESPWAAYARAQLSSEKLLELDRKLEIERLEEQDR